MEKYEDDYVSEDDEDYVPDKEDAEDTDYGSGEEEEAPLDTTGVIKNGGRGARRKSKAKKKTGQPEPNIPVDEADCTADFLDDLMPIGSYSFTTTSTSGISVNEPVSQEAASPEATSSASTTSKTTIITEVFDFAGDEVKIERQVTEEEFKRHEENEKKKQDRTVNRPLKRSGLGDVLTELTKKKKISTIAKTALDWNSFKQENALSEELETFNKGKGGYLKRMEFLQEADVKQFEQEKEMRRHRKN